MSIAVSVLGLEREQDNAENEMQRWKRLTAWKVQ